MYKLANAKAKRHGVRSSITFALCVGSLAIAFALVSCSSGQATEDWFNQQITEIRDKTVPANCEAFASPGPIGSKWSVTATWECESSLDPVQYQQWVESNLRPQFQMLRTDGGHFTAVRNLGGDYESVTVETKSLEKKLRIRVVWAAYPD